MKVYKPEYCKHYIKKDGKILYMPYNINNYLCLIKKIHYTTKIYLNHFNGSSEDDIVFKLYFLALCTLNNIRYYKTEDDYILINNNIKSVKTLIGQSHYFNKLYDITNYITYKFISYRLLYSNKITNDDIIVKVFYNDYITKDKLINDFKINLNKIPNYKELYKVLKKKGIIRRFFINDSKNIIENYKYIYNNIINIENYKKYIKDFETYINNPKNYKRLTMKEIFKLIDKYVDSKYDIEYIKSKLTILIKQYKKTHSKK